jgi:2-hydroxychromene-2-carboxylate isomerase
MRRQVDFFFGIGSRYSYLASTQIERLERETGCRVKWRALYAGALMRHLGMTAFEQAPPPSGQYDWDYRHYDAACWAAFYGVPFEEPKPGVSTYQRFALACVAARRLGHGAAFSKALFHAVFVENRARFDNAVLAEIADRAGLDGAALLGLIDDSETERQEERNIADALAAGAFGVPSFVCEGRLFWGNDRLVLLRDFLTRPDPDAYPRHAR